MPSHKELLHLRMDAAEHAHREAGEGVTRLEGQIRAERNRIDELTAEHLVACRKLAVGEFTDSASILAERDRRSDRLCGLEALHKEAAEALAPVSAEHVAASVALHEYLSGEERERLEAAITAARTARDAAQLALREAEEALNAAVWARSSFLRRLEIDARARA